MQRRAGEKGLLAARMDFYHGLLRVPVARRSHLLALKLLARDDENRPQDAADLRGLLAYSTPDEFDWVPDLLALIEKRGYSRGKDLQQAWRLVVAVGRRQDS